MSQLDYLTLPRKTEPESLIAPIDTLPTEQPSGLSRFCTQVGHRAASLGLVLLLAGAGALAAKKPSAPLLLWAFAAADVGLLASFVSLWTERRAGRVGREARGVVWFSAAVVVAALVLYVVARWLRPT